MSTLTIYKTDYVLEKHSPVPIRFDPLKLKIVRLVIMFEEDIETIPDRTARLGLYPLTLAEAIILKSWTVRVNNTASQKIPRPRELRFRAGRLLKQQIEEAKGLQDRMREIFRSPKNEEGKLLQPYQGGEAVFPGTELREDEIRLRGVIRHFPFISQHHDDYSIGTILQPMGKLATWNVACLENN